MDSRCKYIQECQGYRGRQSCFRCQHCHCRQEESHAFFSMKFNPIRNTNVVIVIIVIIVFIDLIRCTIHENPTCRGKWREWVHNNERKDIRRRLFE